MSSDEEICSDYEVCTDDEGTGSSQGLSDEGVNDSDQELPDESEIEDDESIVDNNDKELIIGSKYVYSSIKYLIKTQTVIWFVDYLLYSLKNKNL